MKVHFNLIASCPSGGEGVQEGAAKRVRPQRQGRWRWGVENDK